MKLNRSKQKADRQVLRKITYQLELLSIMGDQLREPQAKFIKGYRHPLMELRPMPERIFYSQWRKKRYVLLSHYTKKQNKTPRREIEKALRRLDDWLFRKEKM